MARRRVTALIAVGVVGALGGGAASMRTASVAGAISDTVNYTGTATADGVRVQLSSPGAGPADPLTEGEVPGTVAVLTSLGDSSAQSSLLYPGGLALAGPGIVAASGGPQAPPYPLYTTSSFPSQPDGVVELGPNKLEAHSAEHSSSASSHAVVGVASSLYSSKVAVDPATGAVRAEADTLSQALSFGDGILQIGAVRSVASVGQAPGGERTRSATLEITGVRVADTPVAMTDHGLILAGTASPGLSLKPAEDILAQAGIKVHYVKKSETADGVVAPALEIEVTSAVPTLPAPTVTTFRLGSAAASAASEGGGTTAGGGASAPSGGSAHERSAPVSRWAESFRWAKGDLSGPGDLPAPSVVAPDGGVQGFEHRAAVGNPLWPRPQFELAVKTGSSPPPGRADLHRILVAMALCALGVLPFFRVRRVRSGWWS